MIVVWLGRIVPCVATHGYKTSRNRKLIPLKHPTCCTVGVVPTNTMQASRHGAHMPGRNWGFLLQLAIFLPMQTIILHPHSVGHPHVSPQHDPLSHRSPRIVTSTNIVKRAHAQQTHARCFCSEYTRNVVMFPPSQNGPQREHMLWPQNCMNSPPSHKYSTIKSTGQLHPLQFNGPWSVVALRGPK